ncbi:hypothetical protein NM208_g3309 [Fusarium decemcellulare]|uniref:Uncharacterized protein n=1 Tax=Fusarium decemcellulare TaxID=57161 RepID=A0ACC1SPP4_9HYPO|nr:hypothetical protein NM208_g3309 [Fusarium decemcellulare]
MDARRDPAGGMDADIIPLLIETQKSRISQQKMRWIVENLECIGRKLPKKRKLNSIETESLSGSSEEPPFWFRQDINAFKESNFVALSYTWEASEYETPNPREERHLIESRDGQDAFPSSVRNSVLERITRYMQRHQVPLLWIDRHSIPQKVCKESGCRHEACTKKQHALDAMDRVYSESSHPVALLGRPIESETEMATLAAILNGSLVECRDGSFALSKNTTYEQAKEALQLLYKITQDKWWTRAWTFQENYRAGIKMTLLIHHSPDLEKTKRTFRRSGRPLFNIVPGELSIQSVRFSEFATKLCLALHQSCRKTTRNDEIMIEHIRRTAGKYTLLLSPSHSMSSTIVSDVLARGVTEPWDLLAIIANCCQYATRLKTSELKNKIHKGLNLDLSIFALRLLNGEILKNDNDRLSATNSTEVIQKLFFDQFFAPSEAKSLTFNKGCRFVDVRLTTAGIKTTGHLWKLDETVKPPRSSSRTAPDVDQKGAQLSGYHRRRLKQLMEVLTAKRNHKFENLAWDMRDFLKEDAFVFDDQDNSFSLRYRRMMAKELVQAMDLGQELALGCLCDSTGTPTIHRAIFTHQQPAHVSGIYEDIAYVFTSLWSKDHGNDEYYGNDLDHHVSLGVHVAGQETPPRLYAKRWVLGLYFFKGATNYDVIFPWPHVLTNKNPK